MLEKLYQTLEYAIIIERLRPFVTTHLVQEHLQEVRASFERTAVKTQLAQTQESMTLLRLNQALPLLDLHSVQQSLKRVTKQATLNAEELLYIGRVLKNAAQMLRHLEAVEAESCPKLQQVGKKLTAIPAVSGAIHRSLDEEGKILDEASLRLSQLRRQIRHSEQEIRAELGQFMRGKNSRYLSDTVITMRADRYVIPVKAEYKTVVGGIVHDQSASGQTLFMEPKIVVEWNNRRQQYKTEEKEEIHRILKELSTMVQPYTEEIQQNIEVLAQLDFIQAKAKLAQQMNAIIPEIHDEQAFQFLKARHPLLNEASVVPNDIALGQEQQMLLITGPNTGGKTLTLKTVGLLQLMLQTGLAIPVAEGSYAAIFDYIAVDIGDEQSIEQNLSTFSGHMTNLIQILTQVDARSLVLLDELGAGTDPQEGAALAMALLNALAEKKALCLCTTHYPELKLYAYNKPYAQNASMEFDVESLAPTYRLLMGTPGSSNAFEISRRLGLDETIIADAKQNMRAEDSDLSQMIQQLEQERKIYETKASEMAARLAETETLYQNLNTAFTYFKEQKATLLQQAKKDANAVVQKAETKAASIIADLKAKQEKVETTAIKDHELIAAKTELSRLHQEEAQRLQKNKVLQREKKKQALAVGDEVLVETYGQRGILLRKLKDQQWEVQLGILKMKLDEADLTLVTKVKDQQQAKDMATVHRSASSGVKASLDLRGERYEEAMHKVDQYLDQALVAGYPSVTLVHGKGTGALRQGIAKLLEQHRHVDHFEYAPANAGGNGATIVYFKN